MYDRRKVISGAIPPLSDADWEIEFQKYKASPEYILNHLSSSEEFGMSVND